MWFPCFVVALRKASPRPHSSVVCRCQQDDFSSVALGTECFPITILSRKIWMKNTLLYLPHIPKRVGFLGHRMSFGHIFQVSFGHSSQMSSAWPRLAGIGHWTFPSCNTLYGDLNKRYLIISSAHPILWGFPSMSNECWTHLPTFILPYVAEAIITTWSGLHLALNVSQLQYSLSKSESKYFNTPHCFQVVCKAMFVLCMVLEQHTPTLEQLMRKLIWN